MIVLIADLIEWYVHDLRSVIYFGTKSHFNEIVALMYYIMIKPPSLYNKKIYTYCKHK